MSDDLDFKGWYVVEFVNSHSKLINLDHAIRDVKGYVMYLVDQDKRYYNFNTIWAFRKESING